MSKLSKWIVPILLFVALVSHSAPSQAQGDPAYQRQVRNALLNGNLMKDALRHNYNLLTSGYQYGYIWVGSGNYQTATFHLEAGYVYLFLGACDSDCTDMDFALIGNQDEGILAEDTGPDDTPGIQFQPRRTGDYTIVSKLPKCSAFVGCYWAFRRSGNR